MTAIDPNKEPRFQQFVQSHPDISSGPERGENGQLVPSSLYDLRGAVYAGDNGTVRPGNIQPHFGDEYKLPGYSDVNDVGPSGFSVDSNLSKLLPQHAGFWYGDMNGDQNQVRYQQPVQQLDLNSFYPSWFGQKRH